MDKLGGQFLPPPWHPDAHALHAYLERMAEIDIEGRLTAKEKWEHVPHWMNAQLKGGSGLVMASELRKYLLEYDDRLIRHGPHSLPTSFNVVEAFLEYDTTVLLFGLHEEREHLLSIDDYFDWYAGNGLPRDPELVVAALVEDVIYSYDMASANAGYRIKGQESTFVISAVSFVRHGNELSCILVAGEQPAYPSDADVSQMKVGPVPVGKENIQPNPKFTPKDRYLDSYPDFSRVMLLTRLDLRDKKHDVRYIALDVGSSFVVLTDDPVVWRGVPEDERPKGAEAPPSFARHNELFSALAAMIYLPLAFADLHDRVSEIEAFTELGSHASEKFVKEAIAALGPDACRMKRNVRCLASLADANTETTKKIQPPDLEFQTDGFWKPLRPGEIGKDKAGKTVIGRTWVVRHDSWSATSPSTFLVTRQPRTATGPDPGTIYLLRSPAHEQNLYKIGLTRRSAEARAKELSSVTGAPLPFAVLGEWDVGDCKGVESECHRRLDAQRVNPNREFFHGRLQDIIAIIYEVVALSEERQSTLARSP